MYYLLWIFVIIAGSYLKEIIPVKYHYIIGFIIGTTTVAILELAKKVS